MVSDTSIGAGLRRIEAVTGPAAERFVEERLEVVDRLSHLFKVRPAEVPLPLRVQVLVLVQVQVQVRAWLPRQRPHWCSRC